ncbi:MAG: hypothetical protein AB7O98_15245 [Hyphomonadaceae bacterium]
MSPEQYAAELVAEAVTAELDEPPPGFIESADDLRASLELEMRQLENGEGELIPHEQVMAEMRAELEAAKARTC